MKYSFRYMAAAPKEILGTNDMEYMMQMGFSIGKDGEVNLCFGDAMKIYEDYEIQQMTESAYPNQGEMLFSKQGLWLSMFTRHMDQTSVMEIEMEE